MTSSSTASWSSKLASGMMSGTLTVVIKTALNLLLIPVMMARLGLEEYGFYVLLITQLEMVGFLDFGLPMALAKQVASAPAGADRQAVLSAGHGFLLLLALAFLAVGLSLWSVFPSLFHLSPMLSTLLPTVWGLLLLEMVITVYGTYYQTILLSHGLNAWNNIGDLLCAVVTYTVGLLLILAGHGLVALMAMRVVGAVARFTLLMSKALQAEPDLRVARPSVLHPEAKQLATLGSQAFLMRLSVMVSHKLDHLVIAIFLSVQAVAVYDVVFRLLGLAQQLVMRMGEGAFPFFSQLSAHGKQVGARRLFLRSSSFHHFLVAFLILSLCVFYPPLLHLLSDGQISVEQTWLLLVLVSPIIWSGTVQAPATYYLFASGRHRYLTVSSVITAACNLGLSLLLVKPMGIVGVAIGTLIPQVIQHQLSLIGESCRRLRIRPWQYIQHVHGGALLPLLLGFSIVGGLNFLLTPLHLPLLLIMAVTGLLGFVVAGPAWFVTTAMPAEKEFVVAQIDRFKSSGLYVQQVFKGKTL